MYLFRFLLSTPIELGILEKTIQECKQREQFLESELFSIPEDDFKAMMLAYEWPKRIKAVIDVHSKRITDEYESYEASLKKRRAEFLALLERQDVLSLDPTCLRGTFDIMFAQHLTDRI